jgi:hypothetical protein
VSHPSEMIHSVSKSCELTLDDRIARIARGQLGLVTLQQALDVGLSYEAVRHRVSIGRLTRSGFRVYAVAGAPRSWERTALAACLEVGRAAVLSHRSAATVWHLALPEPETVDLTIAGDSSVRCRTVGVRVHRSRSLSPADRTTVGRFPVTSAARTLVDVAAGLEIEPLSRVLDDALGRRVTSPRHVIAALDRCAANRPGTGRLRRALSPWARSIKVESVAEGACLRALDRAGLPAPVTQLRVRGPEEFVAWLDFAWPAARVALEVDGFRWHASPAPHENDSRRANKLAALGWTVLRVTPLELEHTPRYLLKALRRLLLTAD